MSGLVDISGKEEVERRAVAAGRVKLTPATVISVKEGTVCKGDVLETAREDMIVLSGGSSAGERDVLESVVKDLGRVIFHGVQIKPGKPTLFGMIEGKPLLGMPSYPTACLTNGYIFLRPASRIMARLPPAHDMRIKVPLAKKYAGDMGRH